MKQRILNWNKTNNKKFFDFLLIDLQRIKRKFPLNVTERKPCCFHAINFDYDNRLKYKHSCAIGNNFVSSLTWNSSPWSKIIFLLLKFFIQVLFTFAFDLNFIVHKTLVFIWLLKSIEFQSNEWFLISEPFPMITSDRLFYNVIKRN